MDLPLVLAGPILRRVDPGLVAVQVFLSQAATVTLDVYEGAVAFDTTNPVFATSTVPAPTSSDPLAPPPPHPGENTIRIGQKLHIAVVTARLPPTSGKIFQSDFTYSYNLRITVLGPPLTPPVSLADLGVLTEHTVSGVTVGPLGYRDRILPSFALPPSNLDDLQIAYGSCRRPLYDDGDAIAWLDDYNATRVSDPRSRVHQLFLGGDQIYADDVDPIQMLRVAELGIELIGTDGGVPIERVKVDQVMARTLPNPDPSDPAAGYTPESAAFTASQGDLPAGLTSFALGGPYPLIGRLDLTLRSAQFTSEDGINHMISFGEFAALYLMVWSPACWGLQVPGALRLPTLDATTGPPLAWLDTLVDGEDVRLPAPVYPERVPQYLFPEAKTIAKRKEADAALTPAERAEELRSNQRVTREFLLGLGKVQRVLANTPTYMILDDHDVTDDYFLNPIWRHRVLGSALGQVILTNAMLAYALFQDWGNNPARYDQVTDAGHPGLGGQLPGDLLDRATELFPVGRASGPDKDAYARIGKMFGHDLDNQPTPDGRFLAVRPPITWHFSIDGPKHRVVALDNRTRRSYPAEIGPPGNVSAEALVDQLPLPPLTVGQEVLVVIAPLQVIGPPVIDELVGRAIYKVFDMIKSSDIADASSVAGDRRMPGTNPDALETWAFDEITYEHFLSRLADHKRVVLLSGDVHNAASNQMSYWRGTDTEPARIVQFTSSGFKNVMPVYLQALDRSAMLLQELLRAKLAVERLGWTHPDTDLVLLPTGRTEDDLVATTRAKLLRSPVLLPTHGWLDDNPGSVEPVPELTSRLNPAKLPEWRWRVKPLLDERADADRPPPIRPKPLDDATIESQLADPSTAFPAMQAVAARHQAALDHMRNTRQMMFRSNFGICRFTTEVDGTLTAIGEVYTSAIDPETQLPVMDAYMVHRAPLGPVVEDPPERLRTTVLSKVPIPEPQR